MLPYQQMRIGDSLSSLGSITKGVPQGSVLGPLLFNIMVNDLLLLNPSVISYADDTTLTCSANNSETALAGITDHVNTAHDWYRRNGLSLNVGKTSCILLTNKRRLLKNAPSYIHLGKECIPVHNSTKILGITLDCNLTMKDHIQNTVNKCSSLLYFLSKIRHLLNIHQSRQLY